MSHIWEMEKRKGVLHQKEAWTRPCSYYVPGKPQPEGGEGQDRGEGRPPHTQQCPKGLPHIGNGFCLHQNSKEKCFHPNMLCLAQ